MTPQDWDKWIWSQPGGQRSTQVEALARCLVLVASALTDEVAASGVSVSAALVRGMPTGQVHEGQEEAKQLLASHADPGSTIH